MTLLLNLTNLISLPSNNKSLISSSTSLTESWISSKVVLFKKVKLSESFQLYKYVSFSRSACSTTSSDVYVFSKQFPFIRFLTVALTNPPLNLYAICNLQ